jgi:hypothetical protein
MSESILYSENFKNQSRNLALGIKTYINGIGKIEDTYKSFAKNSHMKNFVDFEELILKQSEVVYHNLCDHISNVTSDIIAILAQSFVKDEVSYDFENEVLANFNDESEMIQQIVENKDGQAYDQ